MKKIYSILFAMAVTLGFVSCVEDDLYQGPATISNIAYSPTTVTPDDEVTVTAEITDLKGIASATIKYKVNGGAEQSATMSGSGNNYNGKLPKAADEASVEFYIEAVNLRGITTKSSAITYVVGAIPVAYENLVLNELNGNDKFIELYNKGSEAVPLEGVYIEKDGGKVWTGNSSQTLAAGGFFLLYSEDVVTDHSSHPADQFFTSGLSAKKAVRVQLFSPAATSLDDFNLVDFSVTAPASYSRSVDGGGTWNFAAATPGASNAAPGDPVPGLQ